MARNGSLIRIGLLGYGYWGPNLARVIRASQSCELAAVADFSPARLAQAGLKYSGIQLTDRCSEVVSNPLIDAVVIATPVDSHFDLALAALSAGKHVFVEKPITQTSAEAVRLTEESERRRLVLMVDHTFLFEPAVRAISQVISAGELGRVTSWTSERTNRGVVRNDVNVVWDLAVHDFSILDYVLAASPITISAAGTASGGGLEHAANLTLEFPECLTVCIHVDWLAQQKVRRISIQGEAGVLDYDDQEPMGKVTITSRAATVAEPERARVLETEAGEPLGRAIQHFVECIVSGSRPIADGAAALRVVRVLEAADHSLQSMGRPVTLDRVGAGE
jgi:predicted dehydrogenase